MYILSRAVDMVYNVLLWAIFLRALLSWFRPSGYNRGYYEFARLLYQITEPLLAPVRNALPTGSTGIDFSPFIVIFLLGLVRNFLLRLLW